MIIQNSRKKMPSIISILGPEDGEKGDESPSDELSSVAQELITAVHDKDVEGTVSALRACFACLSEPAGE